MIPLREYLPYQQPEILMCKGHQLAPPLREVCIESTFRLEKPYLLHSYTERCSRILPFCVKALLISFVKRNVRMDRQVHWRRSEPRIDCLDPSSPMVLSLFALGNERWGRCLHSHFVARLKKTGVRGVIIRQSSGQYYESVYRRPWVKVPEQNAQYRDASQSQ